jgi:hypothetical protein
MHAIALWRLENGERMKVLDQLLGSTSIFATVVTQLKFRNIGFVGAGLIALWALSPVGGQASLRVLGFGTATSQQAQTIQYLNINSTFAPTDPVPKGVVSDLQASLFTSKALYGAALLTPSSVKNSPMDTWGNIKIPMIEHIMNTTHSDAEGWYTVQGNNTIYSSLIGIPMAKLPTETNTTFGMETSYLVLDCPVLERPESGFIAIPGINETTLQGANGWNGYVSQCWQIATPNSLANTTDIKLRGIRNATNASNVSPRKLYYASYDDDNKMTYAECTINTSYVQIQSACIGSNCSVIRIRPSTQQHMPTGWTVLDLNDLNQATLYWQYFFGAIDGNTYEPTIVQRYFVEPANPFNTTSNNTLLYKLDKTSFATSLAQLLNTFWIAGIGISTVTSGVDGTPNPQTGTQILTTIATVSTDWEILICNRVWLAFLFVATGAMFIAGVFGLVLEFTRRAPDLAMNISSLTRDNPYIHLPPGGSTLDSIERSRLVQNVRVRFGDVAVGHEVGYIAIASCDNQQEVGKLRGEKKGRLYS